MLGAWPPPAGSPGDDVDDVERPEMLNDPMNVTDVARTGASSDICSQLLL